LEPEGVSPRDIKATEGKKKQFDRNAYTILDLVGNVEVNKPSRKEQQFRAHFTAFFAALFPSIREEVVKPNFNSVFHKTLDQFMG